MKYIALLRGINVGGNRKVDMKILKNILESMGYQDVVTYLNSGNVLFESEDLQEQIQEAVPRRLFDEFGFEIQTLIKNIDDMKRIAFSIPDEWQNNKEQKSDVAYLFPEVDNEKIIDDMPFRKELIDVVYVDGAIIWHVLRKDQNKSQLNKLVGTTLYKQMTVRNVNTARRLAED